MLMGMGGGSSHLAVFFKIDNQALLMFISLPEKSFSRHHVAADFRRRDGCRAAGSVRPRPCAHHPPFFFTPPSKTAALAASAAPDTAGHRPNALLPSRNRASHRWWSPGEWYSQT